MKYTFHSFAALAAFCLVSCENPADNTTDAKISDAKEVAAASAESIIYAFTEDSKITFIGSKITGQKSGGFKKIDGQFSVVDGKPTGGMLTIDMNSIYSDHDKLTTHLMNEDFFNVPEFPTATFAVTEFGELKDGVQTVSGNLTMLDVSKNITFPAAIVQTEGMIKLTSTFDIKRNDWGIDFKGKPDDLIRNEVVIAFDLVAKKQAE